MTTDTRPLAERVADILATEDCVVTPLLKEAMGEIERLTASVLALHAKRSQDVDERNAEIADRDAQIEMRGEMIRQLEGCVDGFRRDLEAARGDAFRLLWVFIDTGIDQIGDIDIHARACEINDGEDEMKDASYLQAIREAIDLACLCTGGSDD